MARTDTPRQGRLPRFLGEEHLKRWLRGHPRGQSVLHDLTVEQTSGREPVLIVVGTYMGDWRPHVLLRCYASPAVKFKVIQTQHCDDFDDEPLADEYAEVLVRKLFGFQGLLDKYGCLPNRPSVEYLVRKRTAERMLKVKWQLEWLKSLEEHVMPADVAKLIMGEYPELFVVGK